VSTWKGFALADLAQFGIQPTLEGIEIPYFTRDGQRYRHKLCRHDGSTQWLGASKPQIPYGCETIREHGGSTAILTEGESDALALRLAYPTVPVLGIPGASSWQAAWKRVLHGFEVIYLSFDGDEAGDRLADSVMRDIPAARLLAIPRGFDTRDVLQVCGKPAYRVLLEEAAARARFRESVREVSEYGEKLKRVLGPLKAAA
jgi:DNA primase